MTDAVTIGERYRKATNTSNLKVEARRSGDADLLIAAGWADSLGIKLYRLAGEFDQAARDLHQVKNKTDAIMVLGKLKTLTQARVALVGFAMDAAPRWGVTMDPNITAIVVGKALSAWLDPNCHKCSGVGSVRAVTMARRRTSAGACGGSGKTRHGLGETDAERYFAQRLLSAMDAKMGEADSIMKRYLRGKA